MMRIITGSARGTKLVTLEGNATRPTTERVKEAVFSMIQFEIEGASVLDMFSGSGQMALEALSRGADHAVMCDNSMDAVNIIRQNAQKTHLHEKCKIINTDAFSYLKRNTDKFDIVFIDPPYASNLQEESVNCLINTNALNPGAIVICESSKELDFIPENCIVKRKAKYSKVFVTIFEKESE